MDSLLKFLLIMYHSNTTLYTPCHHLAFCCKLNERSDMMSISKGKTRIQVTIPLEIKEELTRKALLYNRSVSNYIATLILKDLEKDSRD